jgi:excisionase family DNA binding protein
VAKMFYTLDEAAKRLGKSEDQVKQMVASGQLQDFRDRDRIMLKIEQVDDLANLDDSSVSQDLVKAFHKLANDGRANVNDLLQGPCYSRETLHIVDTIKIQHRTTRRVLITSLFVAFGLFSIIMAMILTSES